MRTKLLWGKPEVKRQFQRPFGSVGYWLINIIPPNLYSLMAVSEAICTPGIIRRRIQIFRTGRLERELQLPLGAVVSLFCESV